MSSIETWKLLQENEYFEKHRLYKDFPVDTPPYVDANDIKNKVVVEIGCGYGRNTVFLARNSAIVYAIEVSKTVTDKAAIFLRNHGIYNVRFFTSDTYDTAIPYGIDYVYENLVFQHIEHELAARYFHNLYEKLKIGGKFNMQFRLGNKEGYYPANLEPTVYYRKEEVISMFANLRIDRTEIKRVSNARYLYVIATKVR